MKVQVKNFKNVYGYPSISREMMKAFKGHNVVLGVEALFSTKFAPGDKITIVIDGFAKLRTAGVPILGYVRTPTLVYVRAPFGNRDIVPNSVEIARPFYLNGATSSARPSLSLLLEFNECQTTEQYKEMQCKYASDIKAPKLQKFKWLRRNLNQVLKGTSDD